MADLKISDMTAASEVANADVVPVVQGGANVKATRALLLTAAAGEVIILAGTGGGSFEVDASGNVTVSAGAGFPITLSANGGTISLDGAGGLTLNGPVGNQATFGSDGNISAGVFSGHSVNLSSSAGAAISIGTAGEIRIDPAGGQPLTIAGSTWPATAGGSSAMTGGGGSGGPVFSDSTFNGGTGSVAYTIEDIVAALKSLGILAS